MFIGLFSILGLVIGIFLLLLYGFFLLTFSFFYVNLFFEDLPFVKALNCDLISI